MVMSSKSSKLVFENKVFAMIPEIHIEDFNYPLPDGRIAKYPLPERDSSKLLVYDNGVCCSHVFRDLPGILPSDSIMVFNDTKVVPARLFFRRETGAHIEIFCLEPDDPSDYNVNFASTSSCRWKCVIGNAKRWKNDILSFDVDEGELANISLKASLIERDGQTGVVEFSWSGGASFSKVLELCGQVPIPPYLNRGTEAIDLERYQTMYAHIRGSVAAPTAGLHFTEATLEEIKDKGIDIENVCLHVGAGTFLPVKSSLVSEHPMHREPFTVSSAFLKNLRANRKKVIAVGTTSVRTLESIYYVGADLIATGALHDVGQWDPYTKGYTYSLEDSLDAIIQYLEDNGLEELKVGTRIIIVPGFRFRIVDMMVTNFHQPQSTLLLLISAFVGGDWHTIYDYALANDFRFLSYGDSSLLYRKDEN